MGHQRTLLQSNNEIKQETDSVMQSDEILKELVLKFKV